MDRKSFLKSTALAATALSLPAKDIVANQSLPAAAGKIKIPPYLKKGDMIGITSPAGYITREDIIPSATLMQQWGYTIRAGYTIGKRDFTFGGTDAERLHDLQLMLDDPQVKAIMCARGGYGAVRIVDKINWDKFKANPKWLIGFSDITTLHSHIHAQCGVATIHSKMCNSFPDVWADAEALQQQTILSINDALSGVQMKYTAPSNVVNRMGTASGILVGGNLKTLESLAGSASDINTDGKILFVEDTGEYLYSIDRMFWNLKRSGKLSKLKGLIVGGMKIKQDTPGEYFGKTLYDIVSEKVAEYHYPVCHDFPVGHQVNSFALKCGVQHQLTVTATGTALQEVRE